MLVRVCDQSFGIPSADVVEVFWLSTQDIQAVEGGEVITHRDAPLRLVRLRQALRLTGVSDIFVNKVHVVVVEAGGRRPAHRVHRGPVHRRA